jgi:hypothetical protein
LLLGDGSVKEVARTMNVHPTIEWLLDVLFPMQSVSYQGKWVISSSQNFFLLLTSVICITNMVTRLVRWNERYIYCRYHLRCSVWKWERTTWQLHEIFWHGDSKWWSTVTLHDDIVNILSSVAWGSQLRTCGHWFDTLFYLTFHLAELQLFTLQIYNT